MEDVRLDGRMVLVTGANTGIGKETAMDMARRGARVIVCSRNQARGEEAVNDIKNKTGNQNVIVGHLDLASFASIRNFAKHIRETEERLDILINNAGIMACPYAKTVDGFESQFGVNHLGHFLLTSELLPLIKASTPSRIVNVSSMAHESGKINFDDLNHERSYDPIEAYCQSKLANILFTRELHRRLLGTGVTAYSLHPGIINTNLFNNIDVNCCMKCCVCCCRCCLKGPAKGALTSIHCAVTVGLESQSGKYFSDCAVKTPKPQAEDDVAALRLWEVSEQLTKNASSDNSTAEAS